MGGVLKFRKGHDVVIDSSRTVHPAKDTRAGVQLFPVRRTSIGTDTRESALRAEVDGALPSANGQME